MAGQTWFSKIEVIADLEAKLGQAVGDSLLYGKEVTDVHQVTIGLLVFGIVSVLAIRFAFTLAAFGAFVVIPKKRVLEFFWMEGIIRRSVRVCACRTRRPTTAQVPKNQDLNM